ncbi:unnamed protein product, partial [Nesidiocoris tenuis]
MPRNSKVKKNGLKAPPPGAAAVSHCLLYRRLMWRRSLSLPRTVSIAPKDGLYRSLVWSPSLTRRSLSLPRRLPRTVSIAHSDAHYRSLGRSLSLPRTVSIAPSDSLYCSLGRSLGLPRTVSIAPQDPNEKAAYRSLGRNVTESKRIRSYNCSFWNVFQPKIEHSQFRSDHHETAGNCRGKWRRHTIEDDSVDFAGEEMIGWPKEEPEGSPIFGGQGQKRLREFVDSPGRPAFWDGNRPRIRPCPFASL